MEWVDAYTSKEAQWLARRIPVVPIWIGILHLLILFELSKQS